MPDYALEGPTWPTNTLTWSFADPANPANTAAFSAAIGAAYQQTVADAFTRWTSVSGLRFTQVADSASADIRVGWGDFSGTTALGLTNYLFVGRTFSPNVEITLQDPRELALTQDPALGWVYAAYNATLSQVVTHEIGHALGLDHNGDTHSIMYPVAVPTSRDLDGTDIAGIDALYGISAANPGQFSISGVTAAEGDSGTTIFSFTVTRTGGTSPTSVRFATVDGTATTAAGDYLANAGAIVFAEGVTSRAIAVSVPGNTFYGPDKSFGVQLSDPTNGATIATASATGTILNDDAPPGSIIISNVTLAEGSGTTTNFVFTITRSGGTSPFSVDFRTADGTATAATFDYFATSGTLSFAAGITTQTVTVQVIGDYSPEPDETFSVLLSNATNGATITGGTGTGTIVNDDPGFTSSTTTSTTTTTITNTTITTGTPGTATGTGTGIIPATLGVYRFFDRSFGTHFFTASAAERNTLIATRPDLAFEGVGLQSRDPATADGLTAPVYRFFDTAHGTHFFTASAGERATILATRADLKDEGVGFYEHTTQAAGDQPVYRFFDTAFGTHFYTADAGERATILATRTDLKDEGIGFYAPTA